MNTDSTLDKSEAINEIALTWPLGSRFPADAGTLWGNMGPSTNAVLFVLPLRRIYAKPDMYGQKPFLVEEMGSSEFVQFLDPQLADPFGRFQFNSIRLGDNSDSWPSVAEKIPGPLLERLDTLSQLTYNWDSYGAPAISPDAVEKTKAILCWVFSTFGDKLPLPSIAPGSHGGFGIEWQFGSGNELLIDVSPDVPTTYLLVIVSVDGDEEECEGVLTDLPMLDDLINQVKD